MDDPACKWLFSRPRMVRDLLRDFAARDWSGALDFASLTPLPDYVSADLRRRHGDLVCGASASAATGGRRGVP